MDEELDSDFETFISLLKDASNHQSGGGISDKVSPQSSATKKRRKRKTSEKNELGVPSVSSVSPDPGQENMYDRQNSLTPDGKEERLSPTVLMTSSTPQRSRLSQLGHNSMMNRRRLSDLFQQPDKDNVSVAASRSVDSTLPQRR